MFDNAGLAYPDDSWTWDDLTEASAAIYDKTGKYGFMAYADEQLGYWNFVYQAGGHILNEDKTKAGFMDPATRKGMEFTFIYRKNHGARTRSILQKPIPEPPSYPGRAPCTWKATGT